MSQPTRIIGPLQMGKQLVEALGLEGIKGILKLQITCEGGNVPTLTIVRAITQEEAGAACLVIKEWQCDLQPNAPVIERPVNADGSVGEARVPLYPSLHPRED